MACVNVSSREFKKLAKRNNVSKSALELIIHQYWETAGNEDFFPSDVFIQAQLGNTVYHEPGESIRKLWEKEYSEPKEFKTLEEVQQAQNEALKYFPDDAVVYYQDSKDNYVLSVKKPVEKRERSIEKYLKEDALSKVKHFDTELDAKARESLRNIIGNNKRKYLFMPKDKIVSSIEFNLKNGEVSLAMRESIFNGIEKMSKRELLDELRQIDREQDDFDLMMDSLLEQNPRENKFAEKKEETKARKYNPDDEFNEVQFSMEKKSSFTFDRDGVTITTPFELNEEQKDALNAMNEFIYAENSDDSNSLDNNIMTLSGFAGTGKTSLMEMLANKLDLDNKHVYFTATTNKAAKELRKRVRKQGHQATTIHSLLKLVVFEDASKPRNARNKILAQVKDADIDYGSVLVIDEASMVNESLYKEICGIAEAYDLKVIFVGDPAQLAPVKEDRISIVFRNPKNVVTLTKVERTGDNAVLAEATLLRSLKNNSKFTGISSNDSTVSYIRTGNQNEISRVIKYFIPGLKKNPDSFRILAFTNQKIAEYNRIVRSFLGYNTMVPRVGEPMMGYYNWGAAKDEFGNPSYALINSDSYTVSAVGQTKERLVSLQIPGRKGSYRSVKLNYVPITLKNDLDQEYTFNYVDIVQDENNKKAVMEIALMRQYLYNKTHPDKNSKEEPLSASLIEAYEKKYYELKSPLFINAEVTIPDPQNPKEDILLEEKVIDFGYAMTVHKSQGSTFENVLIDDANISIATTNEDKRGKYAYEEHIKDTVDITDAQPIGEKKVLDLSFLKKGTGNADPKKIMAQAAKRQKSSGLPMAEDSKIANIRQQLKYVAISRASKTATIISNNVKKEGSPLNFYETDSSSRPIVPEIKTNDSFATPNMESTLQALRKWYDYSKRNFTFDEKEHKYYLGGIPIDMSVTQFTEKIYGKPNIKGDYTHSQSIGRSMDSIYRDFFQGKDVMKITYPNLNDRRKAQILKDLKRFEAYLNKRFIDRTGTPKYKVITTEFPIGAFVDGVEGLEAIAGTMDMLVVDGDGNLHIFDFKAKNKPIDSKWYDKETKTWKTSNDRRNYTAQLNLYRAILEAMDPSFKGKIKSLQLVWMDTMYPPLSSAKYTTDDAGNITIKELESGFTSSIAEYGGFLTPSLKDNVKASIIPLDIENRIENLEIPKLTKINTITQQIIDLIQSTNVPIHGLADMIKYMKEHPEKFIQEASDEQKEMAEIKAKAIADGTFMKAPNGKPTNLTERQWLQVRTKPFINWFGDWIDDPANASKVVDENGEPKVMYHYTDEKFTKFSLDFFGAHDPGDHGRGFYFTSFSPQEDGYFKDVYGDIVMPVFLNIKNPVPYEDSDALDINGRRMGKHSIVNDTDFNRVFPNTTLREHLERHLKGLKWDLEDIEYKLSGKEEGIDINDDFYNTLFTQRRDWRIKQIKEIEDKLKNTPKDELDKSIYANRNTLDEYDGVFNGDFEVVVKSPNQIKSATDNVGTFSTENDDIYMSIESLKEMEAIKARTLKDGTYMKAPNGKDTNLTENQWLLSRTKAFKERYGDWEKLNEYNTQLDFEKEVFGDSKYQKLNVQDYIKGATNALNKKKAEYRKAIKEGTATTQTKKALSDIENALNSVALIKKLIEKADTKSVVIQKASFEKWQKKTNRKNSGIYGEFTDNIFFTTGYSLQQNVPLVLHEIVHSVTFNKYKQEAAFKKEVDKLFNYIRREMPDFGQYGLTNPWEMLAEVANPEFQRDLADLPSEEEGVSVFQKVVDLIKQAFNLSPSKRTALEDLVDLIAENAENRTFKPESVSIKLDENGEPLIENNELSFYIGKRARSEFEEFLRRRRPDMSEEQIQGSLDFLDLMDDSKENTAYIKTAVRWIANNSMILPRDAIKARQLFKLARKKNIDIQKYKSFGELITSAELKKKDNKKPFNPDKAKTFSNKRTVTTPQGRTFTVYDVENTEEGQRETCKAVAAHYEVSPWCLTTFTASGEPTRSAKTYWNTYNAIPRKIAFEDGRPVAFSSNDSLPESAKASSIANLENSVEYLTKYPEKDYLGRVFNTAEKREWHGIKILVNPTITPNGYKFLANSMTSTEILEQGVKDGILAKEDSVFFGFDDYYFTKEEEKKILEHFAKEIEESKRKTQEKIESAKERIQELKDTPDSNEYWWDLTDTSPRDSLGDWVIGKNADLTNEGDIEALLLRNSVEEAENALGTEFLQRLSSRDRMEHLNYYARLGKVPTEEGFLSYNNIIKSLEGKPAASDDLWFHEITTENGKKKIFGFATPEGDIYLDENSISLEHPIHEYTHIWDSILQKRNEKLWKRGVELMEKLSLWKQVVEDENYGKKWDKKGIKGEQFKNLVASEVHARLVGKEGERLLNDEAKKRGLKGIVNKVRAWILEAWKSLKATFGEWKPEDLKNLTLEDFNRMTLRDLLTGLDIKSYEKEAETNKSQVQPTTTAATVEASQQVTKLSTKDAPLQIYSDGSHIKGTENIGYGAVFEHNGKQYGISGTEEGEEVRKLKQLYPDAKFSNPTMEMLALATVLEHFASRENGEDIVINQDYIGAVNYAGLWEHSEGSPQRAAKAWKAKEPYIAHLVERAEAAINKIINDGGSVKINWVKGHQKGTTEQARMNDAADSYAKSRDLSNTIDDAYATTSQQQAPIVNKAAEAKKKEEQKTLTIIPANSTDVKAPAKGKISNKFIGFAKGIQGSSTAYYAMQAGDKANMSNYSVDDTVFVSIPGLRGNAEIRHAQQNLTIDLALKALEDGATLITDDERYVKSSTYNEGEKKLAEALKKAGAEYSEIVVDDQLLGVWKKPVTVPTQETKKEVKEETPAAQKKDVPAVSPVITSSTQSNTNTKPSPLRNAPKRLSMGYRKSDPKNNPNTAYLFTDNAQAYVTAQGLDNSWIEEGYNKDGQVKTGVTDSRNQAGIRASSYNTYGRVNINPNAFGLVVKKYQQRLNQVKMLDTEGLFQDTPEDRKLFEDLNTHMFNRLDNSGLAGLVFPDKIALGKASLPYTFAEWLQKELYNRYGVQYRIDNNTNAEYPGFGLQFVGFDSTQQPNPGTTAAKVQAQTDKYKEAQKEKKVADTHAALERDLGGDEVAKAEIKDAVKVAKQGISFEEALAGQKAVFTNEEIGQIKKALNGENLRVLSVSRETDPVFFAEQIIAFLEDNALKDFSDPTRVNAMEIWSKHDGLPMKDILEACKKYKVAPMVSFSITGLGASSLERGVMKYQDLLKRIESLIKDGTLNPTTTTIRIDPLLPGITDLEDVKQIVEKAKSLGIKKFVTSVMQSYGYKEGTSDDRHIVSGINNALASEGKTYDWDKYYGRITREDCNTFYDFQKKYEAAHPEIKELGLDRWSEVRAAAAKAGIRAATYSSIGKIHFIPKQEYIDELGKVLLELDKDPEITIQTCSFVINGLKESACLDPLIIERITGVNVMRPDGTYDRDTSRPLCMCFGCHGDFFLKDTPCYSSCAYCYAAHSVDNNLNYYNNKGELIDSKYTRTFREERAKAEYSSVFNVPTSPEIGYEDVEKAWRNDPTQSNPSRRVYIKGKKAKGYFEVVKDKEDYNYSVHFKPYAKNNPKAFTEEEKALLFQALADTIPAGARVSTWGKISKGGIAGLKRFEKLGFSPIGSRTIEHKEGGNVIIPVLIKGTPEEIIAEQQETVIPNYKKYMGISGKIIIDAEWKKEALQELDAKITELTDEEKEDILDGEENIRKNKEANDDIADQIRAILKAKNKEDVQKKLRRERKLTFYNRVNDQIRALDNSDVLESSEIRHIAELIANGITDTISEIMADPTKVTEYFPDLNIDINKLEEKDRKGVVNLININNIIDYVKEKFNPMTNELSDFSNDWEIGEQYDLILANWDGLMHFARTSIIANEGFGIRKNYLKKGFDTVVSMKLASEDPSLATDPASLAATEEREGDLQEHWQIESRTIDVLNSMSEIVRQALHECYLEHPKGKNPNKNQEDRRVYHRFGIAERVNKKEAVQNILMWTQGTQTLEQMIERLEAQQEKYPWLGQLLNRLNDNSNKGSEFKSQFFGVMNRHFQRYSNVRKKRGILSSMIVNEHPALSVAMQTIKSKYNIGVHPLFTSSGAINKTSLNTLLDICANLNTLTEKYAPQWKEFEDKKTSQKPQLAEEDIETLFNNLSAAAKLLGVEIPDNTWDYVISADILRKGEGNFIKYLGMVAQSLTRELQANRKEYEPFKFKGTNSIDGTIRNFLTPIAEVMNSTTSSSFYSDGKMYQSYVIPSNLTKLMSKLTGNAKDVAKVLKDEYAASEWYKTKDERGFFEDSGWKNEWLYWLATSSDPSKLLAHKVQLNFNKHSYMRTMNDSEYALSLLAEYYSELKKASKDPNENKFLAWFRVPMLSNKPSSEFIRFWAYRGANYKDKIVDGLFNMFDQEVDRIQTVRMRNSSGKKRSDAIKNFDENGSKFCFLPFLNPYIEKDISNSQLLIRDKDGKATAENSTLKSLLRRRLEGLEETKLSAEELSKLKTLVKKAIRAHMEQRVQNIMDSWETRGILEAAKKIEGIQPYNVRASVENFLWNDNYAAKNILQLTIGDIAFYKDAEDLQKRLAQIHAPGTRPWVDAVYNGQKVSADGKYRTIILKDFDGFKTNIIENIKEVFDRKIANATSDAERKGLENLKDSLVREPGTKGEDDPGGVYYQINVADAQGYSSPTSYRKKAIMFGKWSEDAEKVYQKLQNNEPLNYTELKVAFQPLKPFVYSRIKKSTGVENAPITTLFCPFQAKNAEYLLIMADAILRGHNTKRPNLLRAIYNIMEDSAYDGRVRNLKDGTIKEYGTYNGKGIDTVQFESAIKSTLQSPISIHQFEGKFQGEIFAYSTLRRSIYEGNGYNPSVVHEAAFEDYCLQQEVPEHFKDHDQAHGSQIRMITPSDLDLYIDPNKDQKDPNNINYYSWTEWEVKTEKDEKGREYKVKKPVTKRISAKEFKKKYEEVISANIEESLTELAKELCLSPDMDRRDRNLALSEFLQNEIADSPRYGTDLFQACFVDPKTGEFRIPKGDPVQSKRIEQLINSLIKNRVNKQTLPGGPIVQVSNFGTSSRLHIRFHDKKGGLLLLEEEYNPAEHGNKTYKEYCAENQAGIAYFEALVPIWSDKLLKYFGNSDGTIDVKRMEELDPELLQMISYRIPTEDKYSCAPIKVVGFLPREAGEAIMLPYELTSIDGSDFDVDKRYIMMKHIDIVEDRKALAQKLYEKEAAAYKAKKGRHLTSDIAKGFRQEIDEFLEDPEGMKDMDSYKAHLYEELKKMREAKEVPYKTIHPVEEDGRKFRDNQIVDMTWGVLTHEKTAAQILNPGGFDEQKKIGYLVEAQRNNPDMTWEALEEKNEKELKKLSYREKDLTWADTQLHFYHQNNAGSSLIGVFAVNKVAHATLEGDNIYISVNEICGETPFTIAGFEFAGHMLIDAQKDREGNMIGKVLGSLVAASADTAKDPVLDLMNINMTTAGILTTMLRMGMPFRDAALFLSQKAIKDALDRFNYSRLTTKDYKSLDEIIKEMLADYEETKGIGKSDSIHVKELSREELQDALAHPSPSTEYKTLEAFLKLKGLADAMRKPTLATRFNSISNAVGPQIVDNLILRHKMDEFRLRAGKDGKAMSTNFYYGETADSPKVSIDSIFAQHPLLGSFAKTVTLAEDIFSDMPIGSTAFRVFLNTISYNYGNTFQDKFFKDKKLLDQLANFYLSSLVVASGLVDSNKLNYYINDFPKEFFENGYKEKYPNNLLIQAIRPITRENNNRVFLSIDLTGMETDQKEYLSSAWTDLHKKDPVLSKKLFDYCFFRAGIGFSPKTFMALLNTYLKEHITVEKNGKKVSYVDIFDVNKMPAVNNKQIFDMFIKNNWDNKKVVPVLEKKDTWKVSADMSSIEISDLEDLKGMKGTPFFKLEVEDEKEILYQLYGTEDNAENTNQREYYRVDPLGDNKDFLEINLGSKLSLEDTSHSEEDADGDLQFYMESESYADIDPETSEDTEELKTSYTPGEEEQSQLINNLARDYFRKEFGVETPSPREDMGKLSITSFSKMFDAEMEKKGIKVDEEKAEEELDKYC